MELDAVVGCGLKFVGVEVLDDALLPAGSNRLLSSLAASENLHMYHVMLLLSTLLVVVDGTVEDQVPGLHLLKLKVNWKRVKLVRLVPTIQLEPEIFS